jgi:hypothetical protein
MTKKARDIRKPIHFLLSLIMWLITFPIACLIIAIVFIFEVGYNTICKMLYSNHEWEHTETQFMIKELRTFMSYFIFVRNK